MNFEELGEENVKKNKDREKKYLKSKCSHRKSSKSEEKVKMIFLILTIDYSSREYRTKKSKTASESKV